MTRRLAARRLRRLAIRLGIRPRILLFPAHKKELSDDGRLGALPRRRAEDGRPLPVGCASGNSGFSVLESIGELVAEVAYGDGLPCL